MRVEVLKSMLDKEGLIGGIDEAGRGPVVGPMVVAGVLMEKDELRTLVELGVRDSKILSRRKRDELYDLIISTSCGAVALYVEPQTIDQWVSKPGLNALEAWCVAILIRHMLHADIIIVDAPSSAESFTTLLRRYLKGVAPKIIAKPKADRDEPVVAAASIIAKVLRDREIERIKREVGIDFGSGYPSDPKTIEALKQLMTIKPSVVRRRWRTAKKYAYRRLDELL